MNRSRTTTPKVSDCFPATSMPDRDWWEALWPDPSATLGRADIPPGNLAIDLCCGDGIFTSALASLFARVIALDLDATLLDQARSRTAVLIPPDRVAFLQANAYDLTHIAATHGGPADCVLLANTFHGVPDQARLARAVAATLRPGGSFVIINWHRLPREETKVLGVPRGPATGMRMTPEETVAAIGPAGFTQARLVDLPPWHYACVATAGPQPRRGGRTLG
ncbi:MAG TPA: class I SAM-dependent methyltransferase [Acetobacteraceae bacterium]|nr:class I SAM-dependent methyltransferase [Acetobacteraceae bacterium]